MLLLVALVAGVRGYVQLVEVDYKQLQDRSGMLTLNASTYNRVAFDDGANTLYVLGRGRFVFTLECFSFRHSCAKSAVIPRPIEPYWAIQAGLLTPFTFARHRLSPLAAFTSVRTFFTMEGGDSEFANFTLPTLKAFLGARSQKVSGYRMPQNAFFFSHKLAIFWSAKKTTQRHFFPPSTPFPQ